jgi:hypothetical protein
MSTSKWKFKLWFAWQDADHEQWLQQQARAGWHVQQIALLGLLHRFQQGAPADMVYRWDVPPQEDNGAYQQLFRDAGWERVADVTGWCCWRKPAVPGQAVEIFTDPASKRQMYWKVALPIALLVAFQIVVWSNSDFWQALAGHDPEVGSAMRALLGLGVLATLGSAYALLRMLLRIRQLKG